MGVRPAGVIEGRDIGEQTELELLNSLEAAAVQLLFFQILEKALHDSVGIRMPLGGKGLEPPQFIDDLAEVPGSKLRALICMEHDAFGNTSFFLPAILPSLSTFLVYIHPVSTMLKMFSWSGETL
jgi:hypothetical protein